LEQRLRLSLISLSTLVLTSTSTLDSLTLSQNFVIDLKFACLREAASAKAGILTLEINL
jgi:hypothetical protein